MKVAKLFATIRNIRQDALHKLTTHLCMNYRDIVVEDLNVKGMVKNHRLARSIMDMGFYEFRRQLEYKSKLYHNSINYADRWYASSKLCSNCGVLKESLSLSDRIYKCSICGFELDRDKNAAVNLYLTTVSSTECEACGEDGSGFSNYA